MNLNFFLSVGYLSRISSILLLLLLIIITDFYLYIRERISFLFWDMVGNRDGENEERKREERREQHAERQIDIIH